MRVLRDHGALRALALVLCLSPVTGLGAGLSYPGSALAQASESPPSDGDPTSDTETAPSGPSSESKVAASAGKGALLGFGLGTLIGGSLGVTAFTRETSQVAADGYQVGDGVLSGLILVTYVGGGILGGCLLGTLGGALIGAGVKSAQMKAASPAPASRAFSISPILAPQRGGGRLYGVGLQGTF